MAKVRPPAPSQVVPWRHIPSLWDLHPQDLPLLRHMRDVGLTVAQRLYPSATPSEVQLGFHSLPSVPHLHLHCLVLPLVGFGGTLKHDPRISPIFVSVEDVVRHLEDAAKGQR